MNRKKLLTIITLVLFSLNANVVFAVPPLETPIFTETHESYFKNYLDFPKTDLIVPKVLEFELPQQIVSSDFAVIDKEDKEYVSHYQYDVKVVEKPAQIEINSSGSINGNFSNIYDYNYDNYVDFNLSDSDIVGDKATIKFVFDKDIRSNYFTLSLGQNVSLPKSITARAIVNGNKEIILSNFKPTSRKIDFLETRSREWEFELQFSQPLRINEFKLENLDLVPTNSKIRFLAYPDKEYRLYFNQDAYYTRPRMFESPDLFKNDGVIKFDIRSVKIFENPSFKLSDTDKDGVPDIYDNCNYFNNPEQTDVDGNGVGDACDDFDRDGVRNQEDNCINNPNKNQADTDGDGIGDVCDEEESRFFERNSWLVWVGLLFVISVFAGLFYSAFKKIKENGAINK